MATLESQYKLEGPGDQFIRLQTDLAPSRYIISNGREAKPNTTEVNRPQLDQLERLTISFIRSHVGSITYFLGRDPLPLKEPLITGFLFE